MMKKLVCGCFGNIYYATILKDGIMSDKDRIIKLLEEKNIENKEI